MNRYRQNMVHTQSGTLLAFKKENSAVCDSMDETWRHYANWNKPVTQRQMIPLIWGIHLHEVSKILKVTEIKNGMGLASSCKKSNGKLLFT